jgi:beta-lactam-binding protein with PASTA domain
MWPDIMSVANAKYGGESFPEPSWKLIQAPQATVPDVRGKSMEEAQSILRGAGFDSVDGGEIDSELPAGTVAGTNPAGGTRTARGSTITVHTSNGKMKVLPDVVGKTEAEARAALAGYKVDTRDEDVTDPTQVGKVISMDPGAGTGMSPGGKVTLVVGKLGPDKGNG